MRTIFFVTLLFINLFIFHIKQLEDGTVTLPDRPIKQEEGFLVHDLTPETKQKTIEVKTNISSRCREERVMFFM